jgi:hypothetical protein
LAEYDDGGRLNGELTKDPNTVHTVLYILTWRISTTSTVKTVLYTIETNDGEALSPWTRRDFYDAVTNTSNTCPI